MTSPSNRLYIFLSRKTIALILLSVNLTLLIPTSSLAEVTAKVGGLLVEVEGYARNRLPRWRTIETQNFYQRGIKPNAEIKEEKESRVERLKLNPSSTVVLLPEEPMIFTAIPVAANDSPIHGLLAKWESSDPSVVSIKQTGEAVARKPGAVTLTARMRSLSESVQVRVQRGTGERFGGKKKQDSVRDIRSGQADSSGKESLVATQVSRKNKKRNHIGNSRLARSRNSNSIPYLPLQDPNVDPLPDNETSSLYQSANIVGAPFGKQKAAALTHSAATDGTETNGNKNFNFSLPIASLPGRGLDTSVSVVYNSAVWTKSVDSSSATWMTYDVDSGWPATGWRLSLGQIEDQGSNDFTLTDPDGTRHALVSNGSYSYETIDGTFIHFYGASGWGTLYYPDGTVVQYGAAGGGYRIYPVSIQDRNGNIIYISYVNNVGPQLYSILDTMGRYIRFYYASNGDLVTITAPGLSGGSDRQVMRFYYTDVTLGGSLFGSGINVSGPSSVHTLQYVYLPGSSDGSNPHTGYKFAYSPYGMVREITQYRGMTSSSTSTTTAGSVTNDGTLATRTTYSYPTSGQSFTDVPTYSTRSDEWAGRTTGGSAPSYSFSVNDSTGVSTVTAPDGTISETHVVVNAGQWDDGLVTDNYIKDSTTTYWRTHMDWELDANSNNPRIYQSLNTDVPANLTKATVLTGFA